MKGFLGVALVVTCLTAIPALAADNTAPSATITWPQEGLTIATEAVEVRVAYAAAGDALVERVELVVDRRLVDASEIAPPAASGVATFAWEAASYADGPHRITVRVLDSLGEIGEETISVRVARDRAMLPPAIRIASPQQGAAVSGRTTVEVAADDPAAVRYVIFLVDDVFKAMSNVPPFAYVWDTTRYLNGLHQLRVKAYLTGGQEALSPALEVLVNNPGGATALREPAVAEETAPTPLAASLPVRAGKTTMPPPMHTESPTPVRPSITVAKAEVGQPGTAPFVSPTGELIRPRAPVLGQTELRVAPVEIAALPGGSEESETPELALSSGGGEPQVSRVEAAPAAVTSSKAVLPAPRAPEPAPIIEVAMLPAVPAVPAAPAVPAPSETPVRTTVGPPILAAPHEEAPRLQVALLPARPVERAPAPKVTAAPAPAEVLYVVQPGDWLWAIAEQHGIAPKDLARANNITNASIIQPGQRLRIPVTPVYFDNHLRTNEMAAVIANGRAIVPFRPVIHEVGGTVVWDSAERRASAVARGHDIAVTIGSADAQVDGRQVKMDAPAALRSSRAVVPLRFLGDALDLMLQYQDGVIHIASGR